MYQIPENKGFLVAVKALITNSKNDVLLLKVRRGLRDSERWDFPGGLMEFDDSVAGTLEKEVTEETGITIENPKLVAVSETIFEGFELGNDKAKDMRVIVIGFEASVDETKDQIKLSEEHENYTWCSRNELKTLKLSKPSKAIITKILE